MMESEYIAITHTAKEVKWLQSLITEVFHLLTDPTPLLSDNQLAIVLTQDHQDHTHSKHIDICYHFIRWMVKDSMIRLVYCLTEDMVTDMLTKVLPSMKVKHFASDLRLRTF